MLLSRFLVSGLTAVVACAAVSGPRAPAIVLPQSPQLVVSARNGLRLFVAEENTDPELRIVLPGLPPSDRAIRVLFPEHVTALKQGDSAAAQLYMFRPGRRAQPPQWRLTGSSLEYQRDLGQSVRLVARATLEEDGVRFRYEFSNQMTDVYDMITAVTDPRLTASFLDQRLERTFVHHADGFDLLASETPGRLTIPLSEWLPVRYLASFRWPVPAQRIERRPDGVTYIYKSRAVDEPFIATRSSDGVWVVASFARDVGNIWSNPELTCQHVDPQTRLGSRQSSTTEIKILVVRASVEDALRVARRQRASLK